MDDITRFRGFSGEILRTFVQPSIFLTSIPLFLYWGVVLLLFMLLGNQLHPIVALAIVVFAASYLLGRFALPAAKGEFQEGFFTNHLDSGEARDFAMRYIVLTLMWLIPCILIIMGVFKNSMYFLMSSPSLGSGSAGFVGLVMVVLYLVILMAPLFTALIATYTDTVGELLTGETYAWVFCERRSDIVSFLALVMGGIFVFFLVYMIPMAVVSMIAMKISYQFGFAVISFFYATPFMLSPVLIGRACGAFVCGGESIFAEGSGTTISETGGARRGDQDLAKAAASGKFGNEVALAAQNAAQPIKAQREKLDALEPTLLALDEEALKSEYQGSDEPTSDESDPCTLFKYAYLALKNGDEDKAVQAVSRVITLTLDQASYLEAAIAYKHFKALKGKLQLSVPHYKALSRAVANMNDFTDATWLLYNHIAKANAFEDISLQKQILQYADEAEKAQKYPEAFAVYNFFVSNFGQSSFCQFAQERANEVKAKMN